MGHFPRQVASFLASQLSSALPSRGAPDSTERSVFGSRRFLQIFWCRRVLGLSESGEVAWRRGQADTWRVTKGDGVAESDSDSDSDSVAEKKLRRETEQLDFCLSVDGLGLGRVPLAKNDRMLNQRKLFDLTCGQA